MTTEQEPLASLLPKHAAKQPELRAWALDRFPNHAVYRLDLLGDAGPVDVWSFLWNSQCDLRSGRFLVVTPPCRDGAFVLSMRRRITKPEDLPPAWFWSLSRE